jgi:ATP-dependent exoDNAse (exonuclease V) beta subunit
VIDLLFQQDGGWKVIYYKTDVAATTLAVSYQEQLKMYERALHSVNVGPTTSQVHTVRSEAAFLNGPSESGSIRPTTSKR